MSDPRVDAAIAHWAPRFIAQGVDYNDFVRTTERIQTWADWCTEWQRTAAEHETLARAAEARKSPLSAADAWVQAAMCHHFGKFVFFDDMEQLRSASAATAADFARAAPLLDPPAEPVRIPYAGTFLPGYVRRPYGVAAPPVVLLIAGLDSTKEEFHTFTGLFLRRGVATLAVDGPGQGEMEFELPIEPDFEKPVGAVLDFLSSRTDLDSGRVAAAGVSLGGYYAARAGAKEHRLAACIAHGAVWSIHEIFKNHGESHPLAPWIKFVFGCRTMPETIERARAFTLDGVLEEMRCPFLIVHGGHDVLGMSQATKTHEYAKAKGVDATLRFVMPEETGADHCQHDNPTIGQELMADWLADVFGIDQRALAKRALSPLI